MVDFLASARERDIYPYDTSAFGNVARRRDNLSAYNVTFEQCEELAAHYKWEGIVPDVSSSPMSSTTDSCTLTHARIAETCAHTRFSRATCVIIEQAMYVHVCLVGSSYCASVAPCVRNTLNHACITTICKHGAWVFYFIIYRVSWNW